MIREKITRESLLLQKSNINQNSHQGDMPSIVIMFPSVGGIIGEIFLTDIIKILIPLSRKIYVVVTFKPRDNIQGNVHVIQMKGYGDDVAEKYNKLFRELCLKGVEP